MKWTRGEQGREEPCFWYQVVPLIFPLTKPALAVLTTRQSVQWPVTSAIILPSSLRDFLLGSKKKHISNGTVRKSAFLLPTLCISCEKEVCLKSLPALKKRSGHGTSQRSLNWDWIQIFFERDKNPCLEDVQALDFWSLNFRNTTFWSAALGLIKVFKWNHTCGFPQFPTGLFWLLSLEITKERYCHWDNMKPGSFVKALIWNVLFKFFCCLLNFKYLCSLQKLFSKTGTLVWLK